MLVTNNNNSEHIWINLKSDFNMYYFLYDNSAYSRKQKLSTHQPNMDVFKNIVYFYTHSRCILYFVMYVLR